MDLGHYQFLEEDLHLCIRFWLRPYSPGSLEYSQQANDAIHEISGCVLTEHPDQSWLACRMSPSQRSNIL